MLKIKSNTNEFTIIFSEKIGKKINAEKFSIPALSFFLLQHLSSFFCFSGCLSFFFVSATLFSLQCSFFLFLLALRFYGPALYMLQPNTAQKAQTFFSFSAQTFLLQFSHSFFLFFLLYSFLVQPKNVTFSPKRFFSFL